MKRSRIILFGVLFLGALTFTSCGSKRVKVGTEGDKKECCEKKDNSSCEKECGQGKTACDTTKTE